MKDIYQIAMVGYEMAYGQTNMNCVYQPDYRHYDTSEYRYDIMSQLIHKSQGSK